MKIVTFEMAKKLKEKGFKGACLLHYESTGGFYSNSIDTYDRPNQELDYSDFLRCFNDGNSIGLIDAPTISQVLKWLREEKKLNICIDIWGRTWGYEIINLRGGHLLHWTAYREDIKSYEDAAFDGIEYVLDNLI
jgi:hypothetical protein